MARNSTLKTAIFDSPFSQTEIAKKAGISESRLSRIIHGHSEPAPEEKKAIARALKSPVHELFPEAMAS